MNYKSILAVAVVALFALSVIPMVSDGSDAGTMTDGSGGIGYSVKDLSGDDLLKILPAFAQEMVAKNVLGSFIDGSTDDYEITDLAITEVNLSQYVGSTISGKVMTDVDSHVRSYKVAFTATCTAGGGNLFPNDFRNVGLLKEVGVDNMDQVGASFKVTATVKSEGSNIDTVTYDSNSSKEIFITHIDSKSFNSDTVKMDVTYTFKDGVADKSVVFSIDSGNETSLNLGVDFDLCGVQPADVTAATRVLVTNDVKGYGSHEWNLVKVDGKNYGPDEYALDPYDYTVPTNAYQSADPMDTDYKVPTYKMYDDSADPNVVSLFGVLSTLDTSLRDDAALKEFFAAHGSVSEDYASAESAANDTYKDVGIEELLGALMIIGLVVVGVVAVIFLILIVVIIILLVRRKKK